MKDVVEIVVTAGDGGAGCVSFRKEKYVPKGGPNGGNGGKGGDVVLLADPQHTTFTDCSLLPRYKAEDGRPGQGSDRTGAGGEDLIIRLPPGTVVRDADRGHVLKDLGAPGDRVVIVRGGRGGRGNAAFATATRQVPRKAEPGEAGETRRLLLELKLVADVGLVGLPNAGKSTLLSRISAARPRIADYPFTTVSPHLGVVRIGYDHSFVVADIPGLIEGASKGLGLGDRFLRHVGRTRLLVHLVEAFPPEGAPDPVSAYRIVRRELEAHGEGLADKDEIVVLTKIDLGDAAAVLKSLAAESERDVYAVSAVSGRGVRELLTEIARKLAAEEA